MPRSRSRTRRWPNLTVFLSCNRKTEPAIGGQRPASPTASAVLTASVRRSHLEVIGPARRQVNAKAAQAELEEIHEAGEKVISFPGNGSKRPN